jgi:diguanylate cyclase (GGDEF)-like protein
VSLRSRLWIVVGALVLVPLVVAGVLVTTLVPRAATDSNRARLATVADAVRVALADTCSNAAVTGRAMALEAAAGTPGRAVREVVNGRWNYAALLRPDGSVLVEAGRLPAGAPRPAGLPACTSPEGQVVTGVVAERVPLQIPGHPELATALVAADLDREHLARIGARLGVGGVSITVLDRAGTLVASTAAPADARALAGQAAGVQRQGPIEVPGWDAVAVPKNGLPWTVVAAGHQRGGYLVARRIALVFAGLGVLALLLGLAIARGLTRPLAQLTRAAERVATGDLDHQVDVESEDEVGRVSAAINSMTGQLRSERERADVQIRAGLERIGDVLSSTHDLDGLLQVVLQAAILSTGARGGLAMANDGTGLFVLAAEQGLAAQDLPVPQRLVAGSGIIGTAGDTGESFRGRLDELVAGGGALRPADGEPATGEALIAPLRRRARVVAVLAVYGHRDQRPFNDDEERDLETLATQAAIAVDNIRLREEAERLSMTDPLTGLRNFRYLSTELAREIERANRFARPLAVLMLDLDHFKSINDTYGHARGDDVLRELAARVSEQNREVDTLARYGGEEFVIVLPETTADGAGMLAERICVAVRRQPFTSEGEPPLRVTLSIGAASYPVHGASAATLMRAADEALYVAKRAGRDRWHLAGS